MKKIIPLFISVVLLASVLPPLKQIEAEDNSPIVTIQSNDVNIREGPGLSYPVIEKAKKDEQFVFISEQNDWFEIKLKNGQVGWIANWLARKVEQPTAKETNQSGIVTTDQLRIRKSPSTNAEIIGYINQGEIVQITEHHNEWAKINSLVGDGWVSTQYLTIQSQTDQSTLQTKIGVITTDILNVRSLPSLQAEVIGKLQGNSEVTIISEKDGWFEIIFGQTTGWIHQQYVQLITAVQKDLAEKQTNLPDKIQGKVGTVTASSLNVRKKNSLKSKVVGTISAGASFKIIEETNGWAKIEYKKGKFGWVAGWYLEKSDVGNQPTQEKIKVKDGFVTILYNNTNIRETADIQSRVIQRANEGERFPIVQQHQDWYEIKLTDGSTAFVAGWIVSTNGAVPKVHKPGPEMYLKNKTIVIDPGHGGRDNGTTGALGTLEKQLTLKTALLVADKLRSAGAHVILTRPNDSYVSLPARIAVSNYHQTDAFISIHFDSIEDTTVRGLTSYYYYDFQKPMAETVHSTLIASTKLKNRETRYGDYYVLRENLKQATLLELGYLSNPSEEAFVSTSQYQEAVAHGIYEGLARYFK